MNTTPHILSAAEFIAQGTTAGAIMSIAAHLESSGEHVPDRLTARAVRAVAHEVAEITGQSLQIPGAVTEARQRARWAENDNRRSKPRKGRAA